MPVDELDDSARTHVLGRPTAATGSPDAPGLLFRRAARPEESHLPGGESDQLVGLFDWLAG